MKSVPVHVGDILVAFSPFHSVPLAEHVEAVPRCPDNSPSRHLGILREKWPFVQGQGVISGQKEDKVCSLRRMRLGKEKG